MKIECKILPITTVQVLIKKEGEDVFYCDIPFPNAAIEDKDFDYKSHAIEMAKESYKAYTEPIGESNDYRE